MHAQVMRSPQGPPPRMLAAPALARAEAETPSSPESGARVRQRREPVHSPALAGGHRQAAAATPPQPDHGGAQRRRTAWETPGGTQLAATAEHAMPVRPMSSLGKSGAAETASPVRASSVQLRPWSSRPRTARQAPRRLLEPESSTPGAVSTRRARKPGKPVGASAAAAQELNERTLTRRGPFAAPLTDHDAPPTGAPRHQVATTARPLTRNDSVTGSGAAAEAASRGPAAHSSTATDVSTSSRRAARTLSPEARRSFAGALDDAAHVLADELSARRRRSSTGSRSVHCSDEGPGEPAAPWHRAARRPAATPGLLDLARLEASDRGSAVH